MSLLACSKQDDAFMVTCSKQNFCESGRDKDYQVQTVLWLLRALANSVSSHCFIYCKIFYFSFPNIAFGLVLQ